VGVFELDVEALHVAEQLDCELVARSLDWGRRLDTSEQGDGVRSVEFLGDPARGQFHDGVVETAHDSGPVLADIDVPLRQEPQHLGVICGPHRPQRWRSQRGDGHRQGVIGIVLVGPA